MRAFSGLSFAFGAAAALMSAAAAQQPVKYDGVDAVIIKNFIGTVKIDVVNDADVALASRGGNAVYPVHIDHPGAVLTVSGDENPDKTRWWDEVDWRRHHERAFEIFLEDYPTLALSVPPGTNVSFDSAVTRLTAGDLGGAFSVRGGHVDGEIGDVATADIHIDGSGDLIVGDVAGALAVAIHGSGDLTAGAAGRLTASIHGSGDIFLGDVKGDVEANIYGSGDIRLGDLGGAFHLGSHGSGDVKTGAVGNGATVEIFGSSGLSIARIAGQTDVAINGSGDVRIADGRAENLRVRIRGSGDFDHQGLATNPDVVVNGSGDIYIRRHEGSVRARGDGDIVISGVHYGDDD